MKQLITFVLFISATLSIHAQGTAADYKRAFSTGTRHSWKMTNGSITVQRSFNGPKDQFIYSTWNGDSTVWYKVNALNGEKELTTDPALNRPRGNWGGGGARNDGYHHWMEVRDEKDGRAENPVNKGTFMIHKDNNLYLASGGDNATQVTFDGVDTCYYSSWGRWSKDGKYYATVLIKPETVQCDGRFLSIAEQDGPLLIEWGNGAVGIAVYIVIEMDTEGIIVFRP